MLHLKDRKGSQKGVCSLIGLFSLVFFLLFVAGCQQTSRSQTEITKQALFDGKVPVSVFDDSVIVKNLHQLAEAETSKLEADCRTAEHYKDSLNSLLWMNLMGVSSDADSLLVYLQQVEEIGMKPSSFFVEDIRKDMECLRTLKKDSVSTDMNQVVARLEYNLTKACLRYVYGQRYGFVNPRKALMNDGIFNLNIELPAKDYAEQVMRLIKNDSIVSYLGEIQPRSTYYNQLKAMLAKDSTEAGRQRIMCNMERSRWRLKNPIPQTGKYIIVNIPAFHLYAFGAGDSVLDMRVVCGAVKTKTPILDSKIEWMELNPKWIIPMSIIKKDVVRHVGDTAYFSRNRYDIFDRATNQQMPVSSVSREMLLSGKYRVAQQSGSHNSLGRIVFRFKNPYSVYLHYTSNPSAFKRTVRAISHGCVRVSKPFELAEYLLNDPDEWLLDRIRISMSLYPKTKRGRTFWRENPEEEDRKLINSLGVKPNIPLYIIYNTLWTDEKGTLQTYPDIYGYDMVLWKNLQTFVK